MNSRLLNLMFLLMLFGIALAICAMLSACTRITVEKPDGTRIIGTSLFQDLAIGRLEFQRYPATAPSSQPVESFRLENADQKARLETLNKVLDRIP